MNTTWRALLNDEMLDRDIPGATIVACTLSPEELDVVFDAGLGGTKGAMFTAWSENRVYFPICYDGAEWVGSAPRNPCDEATEHQGGS